MQIQLESSFFLGGNDSRKFLIRFLCRRLQEVRAMKTTKIKLSLLGTSRRKQSPNSANGNRTRSPPKILLKSEV